MAKQPPRENDAYWLPVAVLARCFAVSPQGFRASILPLVAEGDRRQAPAGIHIFGRAAIEAWVRRESERQAREIAAGDPMLTGPATSEGLERYRVARAGLAELELQERLRNLIDRAKAHDLFVRAAHVFRGTGEALGRTFGPDAAKMFNDGLKEAEAAVNTLALAPEEPPA